MLSGAAGAALIVAAVYVTLPKVSYREIEVPRVTMRDVTVPNIVPRDVTVDHVVPRDVTIEIPRIAAAPRSAEEFENSPAYRDAGIHGLFAGPDGNGFQLDSGQTFHPARFVAGKVELATNAMDDVSGLSIGDPIYCAPAEPTGLYSCHAWHRGKVEDIVVIPVGRRL